MNFTGAATSPQCTVTPSMLILMFTHCAVTNEPVVSLVHVS